MKFRSQIRLLKILTIAASLFWLCTAIAGGKPIKVETVNPNVAAPSEELTVMISGSGFNDNDQVEFFFTGEAEIPENSEISVVGSSKSNGRGTELTVKIKVNDTAQELSYDIVVRSNGRRGKGTDMFRVSESGGGNLDPTFNVDFLGPDMLGIGTNWRQKTSSGSMINYFLSDPKGGSGDINLDYFRIPFANGGPFLAGWGVNCFGVDILTPIDSTQFWQNQNGMAILIAMFFGTTADQQLTVKYHLKLTGHFNEPDNWLPLVSTTVTMTTWRLKLTSKRLEKNYSDISCVGEGDFETIIEVKRTGGAS